MWMWIAAGGGVLYYLYTRKQQEEEQGGELPPTEVVEVVEDGYLPPEAATDKLPAMVMYMRKLAGVMTARMPFIDPISLPKTITRKVVDSGLHDIQDEFDGCFGVGEWQDFILGPFTTKAQRQGLSKLSTDDQRLTALAAYIAFFETDTDALRGFLDCVKSEHAPSHGRVVPFPVDRPSPLDRSDEVGGRPPVHYTPTPDRGPGLR